MEADAPVCVLSSLAADPAMSDDRPGLPAIEPVYPELSSGNLVLLGNGPEKEVLVSEWAGMSHDIC